MKVDPRFLAGEGREIFIGNELLLKGVLETEGGVHLLSGYPGSPIAGYFDAVSHAKELLTEKGIRAIIANNEALSAAMLNGSQMAGCRAIIAMKSVGVHVAADGLILGNLAGAHKDGGAVIIYGDDPWTDSTQVPADSRYISKHMYIPCLEPSDAQDMKDYVDFSFKISRASELFVGLVVTTNLADGGGTVTCRPNQYPAFNTKQKLTLDTSAINLENRVLLPPRTGQKEEMLPSRLARAAKAARELGVNRIIPANRPGRSRLGFVTTGQAHVYLLQALAQLGLTGEYPICKMGMSYPADAEMVRQMAELCDNLVVIEERRGFLEEQLSQVVLQDRQDGGPAGRLQLWGKAFPDNLPGIPGQRGLHPSLLLERIAPLLKKFAETPRQNAVLSSGGTAEAELQAIASSATADLGDLPFRTPTFCPGCPHRDSSNLLISIKKRFMDEQYMRQRHNRGPMDVVFHGDTGCYTMLMFPPTQQLMHNYSGMGIGGGTGAGIDPFITNKQVVFMGDSTFFHSGQIAISQAIKLGQDILFIILDNKTTAMTGHQPTPGVEYDLLGNLTHTQDIDEIVRGIASEGEVAIAVANPEKRTEYAGLLEQMILADGVKIVIADKECGITRIRRRHRQERAIERQKGFLPSWQHMNINQEICRFCLACSETTACPGLRHVETDYGWKMDTDITACVDDGACARIGACWSFERVTIYRDRPQRIRVPELGLESIPEPARRPTNPLWQCVLTGVGGMGIGLATSILVRAGHKEGYNVTFVDKKGLAIRNGGISSQVVFSKDDAPVSGCIPCGQADLIIGVDILEAARALDGRSRVRVGSRTRTAAVINTTAMPTIKMLMGYSGFDVAELEAEIRKHTRSDDYLARDISRICEKYLGSKLYANVMMLGFAFQKGLIPVSMHSMAWAIKDTIRADFKRNLYAFNMGRKLVEDQNLFQGAPRRIGWQETLEERGRYVIRRYPGGQKLSDALRSLANEVVTGTPELSESIHRDIIVRLYDCLRWGGVAYARRYAQGVLGVYAKDSAEHEYAATKAVVEQLARAMLIKDSVFLAELATSPEKYARDREKYNINPANGDRIAYRHLVYSALKLGPWEKALELSLPDWPFHLLKRARFLRRLLPKWHRSEKDFLRRYESLVHDFAYASADEYRQRLVMLSSPSCMSCSSPRCREEGCPLDNRIPDWIGLASQGQWGSAADKLHERNNFPEFTASICPAPCQLSCKQALNDYPVQIRQLERDVIQHAFEQGFVSARPAQRKTGKRVAVVGSGPAGLAAAQQLARLGHAVTVFEKEPAVGGLLRWGIPAYRLEKKLIDRRIEQLRAEGVIFKTGVEVGKDIPAAELRKQFDAICLATGAARSRDLDIPGRAGKGVHQALEFLRQQNLRAAGGSVDAASAIDAKGKVVAVIGGGETGNDCVDTALLQGAREVHQLEILPEPSEGDGHHKSNGVARRWCVSTRQFIRENGQIRGLQASSVTWVPSANGRKMLEAPGSEFTLDVDLALLALGFDSAVPQSLAEQFALATDAAGRAVIDECATSVPGVFAAGDLATGAKLVVNAIATGRKAAEKIDEYLSHAKI